MTRRTRPTRTLVTLLLAGSAIAVPWPTTAAVVAPQEPRTLYVSTTGSDRADGSSPTNAWRSLHRVSNERLAPGDRVLLEGGATFASPLELDAEDAGDAARPVIIASYGTGRVTLSAEVSNGISVKNTAGVHISDLLIRGGAIAYQHNAGISFYNDLPGNQKLSGVVIERVDVSGFRTGVRLGGWNGGSGFRDVLVARSSLHDNMVAGLSTYGPDFDAAAPTYVNERVRVSRVAAFRNLGDPAEPRHNTGSGIVLGSVRGGVVEWSHAYANGAACPAPEGPVGIWAYDSHRVVLQHNVSHHNRTSGGDGGGFDLDQNVSGSVMQYNTSYANDGPGYLLLGARANTVHRDNVVRFNVSSGDARRSASYGGISVLGRVSDTQIYHNTVVTHRSPLAQPPAMKLSSGLSRVRVRNNVLVSAGAGPVVAAAPLPRAAILLQGNAYAALDRSWRLQWGEHSYSSLRAWRSRTGQEYVGTRATGRAGDPKLVAAYRTLTVTNPVDLRGARGLRLRPDSPLLMRGLSLRALFDINVGPRDYFGTKVLASAAVHDVGAYRYPR